MSTNISTHPTPCLHRCIKSLRGDAVAARKDDWYGALCEMMTGQAHQSIVGAFLALLTIDKYTPEILASCALALRDRALPVIKPPGVETIDIVGTGGDGADSFNVSTASAFVVAACGVPVVKHGNRASSSKCGSADLIEASGARLGLTGEQAMECLQRTNFAFLYAQAFHPAMKNVGDARKLIGVRTLFNVLGPLSNPCVPSYQITGVFTEQLGEIFARSLRELGVKRALIVHGLDHHIDEISPIGPTKIWELRSNGEIETRIVNAKDDFGLPEHSLDTVKSGTALQNVAQLERIYQGEQGPITDWVLMNASAALYITGKVDNFKDGIAMARRAIEDGSAARVFSSYSIVSREVGEKKKPSILETIAIHRKQLVEQSKQAMPLDQLMASAMWKSAPPTIQNVLERVRRSSPMALMAEIKRASPSLGDINTSIDPASQAVAYARGGASVISVLTEPRWFKGSLDDLRAVRAAVDSLPNRPCVLLKDFVVDSYQIYEARIAGADTVLLIVAILEDEKLLNFMKISRSLGMEPLVEVANAREMDVAIRLGARLIGVNNRDLHTFNVNTHNTTALAKLVHHREQNDPEDFKILLVALSGIKSRTDVETYQRSGCEAVLVGETLMKSNNPSATIAELLGNTISPTASPRHARSPSSGGLHAPHARTRSNSASFIKPVFIDPSTNRSHDYVNPAESGDFVPLSSMSADLPVVTVTLPRHIRHRTATLPPIVKVCGIQNSSSAMTAIRAGADALGFIFAPNSKRRLTIPQAKSIIQAIRDDAQRRTVADHHSSTTQPSTTVNSPNHDQNQTKATHPNGDSPSHSLVQKAHRLQSLMSDRRAKHMPLLIGVFQNQPIEAVREIIAECGLDIAQLHGNEGKEFALQLDVPCIRVLPVIPGTTTSDEILTACAADDWSTCVLLDTKLGHASGGTGITFDWRIAAKVSDHYPVAIAGGLTPNNVAHAVHSIAPIMVDTASGVEDSANTHEKDFDLCRKYVQQARHAVTRSS